MNQFIPRTSTSTDPLVATLFALECRSKGAAIIFVIPRSRVVDFIRPPNDPGGRILFSEIECEVALEMKPLELERYAVHSLDVDRASEILVKLGFGPMPFQIAAHSILTNELETTSEQRLRLNPDQLREFNRLAFERRP